MSSFVRTRRLLNCFVPNFLLFIFFSRENPLKVFTSTFKSILKIDSTQFFPFQYSFLSFNAIFLLPKVSSYLPFSSSRSHNLCAVVLHCILKNIKCCMQLKTERGNIHNYMVFILFCSWFFSSLVSLYFCHRNFEKWQKCCAFVSFCSWHEFAKWWRKMHSLQRNRE